MVSAVLLSATRGLSQQLMKLNHRVLPSGARTRSQDSRKSLDSCAAGLSSARLHRLHSPRTWKPSRSSGGPPSTQIRDRTAGDHSSHPHRCLFTCWPGTAASQVDMSIPNLYSGLKKAIAKRRPAARCIRHTSFPSHGGRTRCCSPPTASPLFRDPAVRPRRWESTRAQQFHVAPSWLADVFERRALQLAANAPAPPVSPGGLAWTGPAVVCVVVCPPALSCLS